MCKGRKEKNLELDFRDPLFCVVIKEKLTKGIYKETLEEICIMEFNRREDFKKKKTPALLDAEEPRKMTKKHLINLVLWVYCWPYQE